MKFLIVDESYRGRLKGFASLMRGGDVVASKLDGFHIRRRQLRSRLGLHVEHVHGTLEQLPALLPEADAVLFVPSWRHPAEVVKATLSGLSGPASRVPLAIFDTFDQTSSPYFASIPFVGRYIKSQVLRDRSRYAVPTAGGFVVADWVHHHLGFDLGDWSFGSAIPEGCEAQLGCGWNMGVSRLYRYLSTLTRLVRTPWRDRPVQLNRRFQIPDPAKVAKWEWYQEYRRFVGNRVTELCGEFTQTGLTPLNRGDYRKELRRSRIVFSPFGWGEVCFRDFEAVACGAVLVKPDMSHLETFPDIYEDKSTYMAVRWDLGDLPDVCRWLLDNPSEAERIAENARRRLASFLDGGQFDSQVADLLAGLPAGEREPLQASGS